MQTLGILLVFLPLLTEVLGFQHKYAFYRNIVMIENGVPTRRVFGGQPVSLSTFPAVCALFDRLWLLRCSGSIISPNWVLTAAHCISQDVAFVKYNTRFPKSDEGNVASVLRMYQHPEYRVLEENDGEGDDVTELRNDVGLLRTKEFLRLDKALPMSTLHAMRAYAPYTLDFQEIEVLGFGRTSIFEPGWGLGYQLFSAKLKMIKCEREKWTHCVCGVADDGGSRGVCSGDSGGPMTYKGSQVSVLRAILYLHNVVFENTSRDVSILVADHLQLLGMDLSSNLNYGRYIESMVNNAAKKLEILSKIGVTSMGPQECSAQKLPGYTVTSVFTTLYQYADIIAQTIDNRQDTIKMSLIHSATSRSSPHYDIILLMLFLLV